MAKWNTAASGSPRGLHPKGPEGRTMTTSGGSSSKPVDIELRGRGS